MLRPLTALRFPAALAVFLWHAPLTRPGALPLSSGYVGVSFFFLLSGFILAYNYRPPFSVGGFYAARFARVYPVHVFGMLLALAALVTVGGAHWTGVHPIVRTYALVLQALLLQSWSPQPDVHFGGNGPSWSLSDEAFFYALFPFAAALFARIFARERQVTVLFAAAALIALILAFLTNVNAAFDQWSVYIFPPLRFGDFLVGMLLGLAFIRLEERGISRGRADPLLLEVAVLSLFLIGLGIAPLAPQALRFSAAFMPFSAAVIFVFAMQLGPISKSFSHPVLVRLGEASYAFYVVHLSVILIVGHLLARNPAIAFLVALACSVGLSLAVFTYLETPLRRSIRAAYAQRTQEAANPASHSPA